MNRGLFIKVNQCIYCGNEGPGLTDEHGIPLGLLPQGEPGLLLRNATCCSCAKLTSLFERSVLQRLWQPARAGLGLRSYRRRSRPKSYPLTIVRDSGAEDVFLPLDQYPATLQFIEYPPPAFLEGRSHNHGIMVNASRLIQVAGPPLRELAERFSASSFQFKSDFEGLTYERLLLKIAYCFVIAELGLGSLEETYILSSILGDSEEIGTWLGCDGETQLNSSGFHCVSISVIGREIICRVRLFSRFPTPEYVIGIGKLKESAAGLVRESKEKYF